MKKIEKKPKSKLVYIIIAIIIALIILIVVVINLRNNEINKSAKFHTLYTQPYLPKGYSFLEGTNLDTGLVIEDGNKNQYVWIEVPKTIEVYPNAGLEIKEFTENEYSIIEKDLQTYTSVYRNETLYIDDYPDDIVEEAIGLTKEEYINLKQKMLKSIYKNGGFYIGRYETGTVNMPNIEEMSSAPSEIPVIQANAYPYGAVTCSEAQELASSMKSGKHTTSLMFGVQWDLVLKYLEMKNSTQDELNIDSVNWGNHSNSLWNVTNTSAKYDVIDLSSGDWITGAYGEKKEESKILLSTGASDKFMKQNIYDFAGNNWEFTLEYSSKPISPCTIRGGSYGHKGDTDSASCRVDCNSSMYFFSFGFRIALY